MLINEVAKECGATGSNFYTPDGNSYYNADGSYQDRTEYHYVTADDMVKIAGWIYDTVTDCENSKDRISKEVQALCEKYPIY